MKDIREHKNLKPEDAALFWEQVPPCHIGEEFTLWTPPNTGFAIREGLRGRMLICRGRSDLGQRMYDGFNVKVGCCFSSYRELPKPQQMVLAMVNVLQAIVRDGISPAVAVRALTSIHEFRCIFSDDVYAHLGLTPPTDDEVDTWREHFEASFKRQRKAKAE